MAADGGVSFAVSLVNDISGPARKAKSDLDALKKSVVGTKSALEAPSPRNGGMDDWTRRTNAAKRSLIRDEAAQKAKISRLDAADAAKKQREAVRLSKVEHTQGVKAAKKLADDQKKEAKRVADFKLGMAQQKLDKQNGLVDFGSSALGVGAGMIAAGALAAAAAVAYLAVQFGKAAVEAAAFGERSRLALNLLTGSGSAAVIQFDAVRHEAQQLGLDVYDTQAGFQKLLAAQFSIGKSKELIRMSADLQAIGASADQTKRAIVAISQIKNTGYLQGDELNQLREAGVSTELVYEALGKKLGKTTQQIQKMQEKRQLQSDVVIESILEAVRKKTGSKTTGDAGKAFAASSLSGMANVFNARAQNAMIDVGDAILPGLRRLATMAMSLFDKLAADPKLQAFGTFLLNKFDYFVLWVDSNFTSIVDTMTTSLQLATDTARFFVEALDTTTFTGKAVVGTLGLLALTLAIVGVAAFVLMLPLYILIAVIGLVAYGIYKAISWVVDALTSLSKFVPGVSSPGTQGGSAGAAAGWAASIPGLNSATTPAITTAAESSAGARLPAALASVGQESVTVEGEPQGVAAAGPSFDFSGMQVGANVDQDDLVAKIRSQVTKALEEHA